MGPATRTGWKAPNQRARIALRRARAKLRAVSPPRWISCCRYRWMKCSRRSWVSCDFEQAPGEQLVVFMVLCSNRNEQSRCTRDISRGGTLALIVHQTHVTTPPVLPTQVGKEKHIALPFLVFADALERLFFIHVLEPSSRLLLSSPMKKLQSISVLRLFVHRDSQKYLILACRASHFTLDRGVRFEFSCRYIPSAL